MADLKYTSFEVKSDSIYEGNITALLVIIENIDIRSTAYIYTENNDFAKRLNPGKKIMFGDLGKTENTVNETFRIVGNNVHVTIVNFASEPSTPPVIQTIYDANTDEYPTTETTQLRINGSNFGAFDPGICNIVASEEGVNIGVNEWSDTEILCNVSGLSSYGGSTIHVTLNCLNGSTTSNFPVNEAPAAAPQLDWVMDNAFSNYIKPSTTVLHLRGKDFGETQGTVFCNDDRITFGPITFWSPEEILCGISGLDALETGEIFGIQVLNSDETGSNVLNIEFNIPVPYVWLVLDHNTSSPVSTATTRMRIEGVDFGVSNPENAIIQDGIESYEIVSWADNQIIIDISGPIVSSGYIQVTNGNTGKISQRYSSPIIQQVPEISSVVDAITGEGCTTETSSIRVSGAYFGNFHPGNSVVLSENIAASINDWLPTEIILSVEMIMPGESSIRVISEENGTSETFGFNVN